MKYLKDISLYLIISMVLNAVSWCVKSVFLDSFLSSNIVIILVTILAINIAITSILIPKLKDIEDNEDISFTNTYREIRLSFLEQIILIGLSIIVMIFKSSSMIVSLWDYSSMLMTIILTTIFIYSVISLWDTGNALFLISGTRSSSDNEQQ